LRCSNFGRRCEGYVSKEESPPPKEPTPPIIRKLLSKAVQDAGPGPSTAARSGIPAARPLIPPGVVFQDELEYEYFCHFRDQTAIELSGGFEPTLWNVLVLDACDNPSIRQLTIATAALSIAKEDQESAPVWMSERESHIQYALQRYGDALAGIREMVATGQDSMRTALISSLLIFCFENLHGDLGRAIAHAQSAIEMIFKMITNVPYSQSVSRITPLGFKSNASIDDELLTAYMRLDQRSVAIMGREKGNPPSPAHRIFTHLLKSQKHDMPSGFGTLAEARIYLENIKWRIIPGNKNTPPESLEAFWSDADELPAFPDFRSIPLQLKQWYTASDVSNPDLSFQLAQWHDAFSPLLNHSLTPAGEHMFVPAATLHIQALAADMVVSGVFSSPFSIPTSTSLSIPKAGAPSSSRSSPALNPEVMKVFPTANAILAFSRRLVAHPQFHKGFVFDVGIIPSIVKIMMLCPDRALKQEAIVVLKSMVPRREGIWDSRAAAESGERCLSREESQAGLDMIDPMLLDSI
jgi:hypothetical protein